MVLFGFNSMPCDLILTTHCGFYFLKNVWFYHILIGGCISSDIVYYMDQLDMKRESKKITRNYNYLSD